LENLIRKMTVKGTYDIPLVLNSVFVDIAPKHIELRTIRSCKGSKMTIIGWPRPNF